MNTEVNQVKWVSTLEMAHHWMIVSALITGYLVITTERWPLPSLEKNDKFTLFSFLSRVGLKPLLGGRTVKNHMHLIGVRFSSPPALHSPSNTPVYAAAILDAPADLWKTQML